MKRSIDVFLADDETRVGMLRYERQGARQSATFEYERNWLATGFALSPTLPLVIGPQFHKITRDGSAFPDPIADTEPDGWARNVILRDQAKRRQDLKRTGGAPELRPMDSVDMLLAVDDVSRIGALRLRDETGTFCRAPEPGRRTTPPLIELGALLSATRAVELDQETRADLAYLRGRGTSLGGLRPKCSVVDDSGQLSIAKFPSVQDQRAVTKGEVLALRLARLAGIRVAEATLVHSDAVPVALIRRFDRDGDRRLMFVSAATLLGVDPRAPEDHSYTEIVDTIRVHGATAQADIEELWRRIAFSILITNIDDHLRNHGFLHDDRGLWRLAPAFDLNPFPDRARELKTWISEETGPAASIDALRSVGPYFRITAARGTEILAEVESAVGQWRSVGAALGMTARELEAFDDAFEHPEREVARTGH